MAVGHPLNRLPRLAIVTGASSGIGRATAILLGSHGWFVVLVARRGAELSLTKAEIEQAGGQAAVVVADLGQAAEIDRVVREAIMHTGRVDALVNVAGIGKGRSIETPDSYVVQMIATNLLAPIRLMRAIIPQMRKQGSGSIVNIGSVAGEIGMSGIYSATKFGLRGVTDSTRIELSGTDIQVSLVEPGYIRTPLTLGRSAKMPGPEIVAAAVERCLAREHRRLVVPGRYRFTILLARLFPRAAEARYAPRSRETGQTP